MHLIKSFRGASNNGKLTGIQVLFEKYLNWMCCVSYEWKRDKCIELLSNMISWKYITVVCNHCIFFSYAFVYIFSFRLFSYEHWGTENRATNKAGVFWSGWGKLHHKHLKCFRKCMEITPCAHVFFSGKSSSLRVYEEVKDDSRSGSLSTSRTELNVDWVG